MKIVGDDNGIVPRDLRRSRVISASRALISTRESNAGGGKSGKQQRELENGPGGSWRTIRELFQRRSRERATRHPRNPPPGGRAILHNARLSCRGRPSSVYCCLQIKSPDRQLASPAKNRPRRGNVAEVRTRPNNDASSSLETGESDFSSRCPCTTDSRTSFFD